MKADVVIAGSGVSGLTAAAILARAGKKVILVEALPRLGGALRRFKRQGLAFDVGFHYSGCLGQGEMLEMLWRYCGLFPALKPVFLDGGYDQYDCEGWDIPVRGYFNYQRLAEELKRHFFSERKAIDAYFAAVQSICSEVPFYRPELGLTEFLRGYKSRPSSLLRFLHSLTDNPTLISLFLAPAFLYGTPVEDASLEVHSLVAHGFYEGAYTIEGGGQAIVDSFLASLNKLGVEVSSGISVERVLTDNVGVRGVVLSDGRRLETRALVYTGHPSSLVSRVPRGIFRPAYTKRLQGLHNTLSMFAVFARSERGLNPFTEALNYYHIPSGVALLPRSGKVPMKKRPMMMTGTRTTVDGSLRQEKNGVILLGLGFWDDVEPFSTARPAERKAGYQEFKNRIGSQMIAAAEKKWAPLCGAMESLAIGTPLSFRDELNAPEGCAYGARHCLHQYNPDIRTKLPGLLLAGQSTLMNGVFGASISGLVAAGELLGLEWLWRHIQR